MTNKIMFNGFSGFKTIEYLRNHINEIPKEKGVYLIISQKNDPQFIDESIGGHFKDRNPSVSKIELEENWVSNEPIIYIGQAGGKSSSATLFSRLKQYFNFGLGKPVGHWGGRYIWQLNKSNELIVAWKVTSEDSDLVETDLILEFKEKYGKRPFANLRK